LNRIDDTMVFHMLGMEELKQIVGLLTAELCKRAKEQLDINIKFTGAAKELLADVKDEKKYGARPLRRNLQTQVEDVLAEKVLAGEIKAGMSVTVGAEKGKIRVHY